jgi:hypothetical protein
VDDDALFDAPRDFAKCVSDRNYGYFGGRNPLELIQRIMSVPDAPFPMSLNVMHSNVHMSKPAGHDTVLVNIICPPHFVQGGRSIAARPGSSEISVCGMMLPLALEGNATLSATDVLIRPVMEPT